MILWLLKANAFFSAAGDGTQRTPLFWIPESRTVVITSQSLGSTDAVSTSVATFSFFVEMTAKFPSGSKATLCGPNPVQISLTLTSFCVSMIDTTSDFPDSFAKSPYRLLPGFK